MPRFGLNAFLAGFFVEQGSAEWRGMEVRMQDTARAAARSDATGT